MTSRRARMLIIATAALLSLPAEGAQATVAGRTEMVDLSSRDVAANDQTSSGVAMSADGRYVTMASGATNLVPGDTNHHDDVFVRDRRLGTTSLVSVSSTGAQGNGDSAGNNDQAFLQVAISADGRYVAFDSSATNLAPGDTNSALDVFVRDRQRGTTRRVDVSGSGAQSNGTINYGASISADGRYVVFSSDASNLVASDTNGTVDVFVRDLVKGTTRRVSLSSTDRQGNAISADARISGNGRFVAFVSSASNLVAGDTNHDDDIYVRDLAAGTTQRANVSSTGAQAGPSLLLELGGTSDDGRYICFESQSSNLVLADTNGATDVFLRDMTAGTTRRVSVSDTGRQADGASTNCAISGNGRDVAFNSGADNLVPDDTNAESDVFVRDLVAHTTRRVSVASNGEQADDASIFPVISYSGRHVAFLSEAKLAAQDTNQRLDVYVHTSG